MSDSLIDPFALGSVPVGRRLEQNSDGLPDGVAFSVSIFPRATPERIEAARKSVPEIPDERIDRSTDPWTDTLDGTTYKMVRSFFNVVAPSESGATAFTVSDGNLVGLRPAGAEDEGTSTFIGIVGGSRAT